MSTNTDELAQQWAAMHFEVRQAMWSGAKRTFRQLHGRDPRPRVWEVWVEGDRFYSKHGLLGGKMQETNKQGKLKNKGKANEISPEMDALAEARRAARKKWDFEGYDEFVGDMNIDQRGGGVDAEGNPILPSIPHLLSSLPGSFCMYKPQNNIEECKGLLEKADSGRALYTLKRNGLAMWVVVDGAGGIHMYSRRNRPSHKNEGPVELPDGTLGYDEVIPWVRRFPRLVEAVQALALPPYSMMCCELVSPHGDEKDDFRHVCSIEKSLTQAALEKQAERGHLQLYWWDIPFYGGQDLVYHWKVSDRYKLIHEFCKSLGDRRSDLADRIQPIETVILLNTKEAVEYAKENNLEGFVVVDPDGVYGTKGWNLKGKPDRPGKFCAKLKPCWEDDFIAFWDPDNGWGTHGKGKHEGGKPAMMKGKQLTDANGQPVIHGGVGSVGLGQYDKNGNLVYIADCSSGMSYEFQSQLRPENFPFVCEVKYNDRSFVSEGDDTNALTFPVFIRHRTDKTQEECINERL